MTENNTDINPQTLKRIEKDINIKISDVNKVNAGMNNQLFKVTASSGKKYLLKKYVDDERNRMWREYNAIEFLRSQNFKNIPKAYWKSEEELIAVFSFENGQTKVVDKINKEDILNMSGFLANIHNISQEKINIDFPPAVLACFSISDYVKNVNFRLGRFLKHLDKPHPIIDKEFNRADLKKTFANLEAKALVGLNESEINRKVSDKQKRLCPIDFGPHNMLVDNNGNEYFIDFEYFGYDDPARIIADFQMHDRSFGIDKNLKDLFKSDYLEKTNATDEFKRHLSYVENITSVEWLTIYLWSITPEKIEHREFSDKNFEEKTYITKQIDKYKKRLGLFR